MANFGTVHANRVLNWMKGTTFAASPATLYLGLYKTPTGPGSEGTEISGGSYARVAITSSSGWSAISGSPPTTPRQISNSGDIVFPTATADWGDVTHWAISDASTAGNRIAFGAFDTVQSVVNGKVVKALAGQIVIKAR